MGARVARMDLDHQRLAGMFKTIKARKVRRGIELLQLQILEETNMVNLVQLLRIRVFAYHRALAFLSLRIG